MLDSIGESLEITPSTIILPLKSILVPVNAILPPAPQSLDPPSPPTAVKYPFGGLAINVLL